MSGFVSGRDADDFGWPQPPTEVPLTQKSVEASESNNDECQSQSEEDIVMKRPASKVDAALQKKVANSSMSSNKKPARKEVMPEKPTRAKKKAMPVVAAGSKPDVEDNNAEPAAITKKPAAKKLGDPATTGCSKCYFRGCRACNWRGSFHAEARPAHRRQKHGQSGRAR